MNESEFENELRGLKPAAPSLSLKGRIAAALPRPQARRSKSAWAVWLAERLLWTAGGAVAAWALMLGMAAVPAAAPAPGSGPSPATRGTPPPVAAVPVVSEEPIAGPTREFNSSTARRLPACCAGWSWNIINQLTAAARSGCRART